MISATVRRPMSSRPTPVRPVTAGSVGKNQRTEHFGPDVLVGGHVLVDAVGFEPKHEAHPPCRNVGHGRPPTD
jgi:hypothetical protein